MKVDICKTVCEPCPWRVENAHQLHKDVIVEMIAGGVISACHMQQCQTEGATKTTGVKLYAADMEAKGEPFMVCRGFAIARARAGNHANNPMIAEMNMQIAQDGDINDPTIVGLDYIFGEINEKE